MKTSTSSSHYLRHWGVRDLFENPLLNSVLKHDVGTSQRRQNSEKPVPRYAAGFGLGFRSWAQQRAARRLVERRLHFWFETSACCNLSFVSTAPHWNAKTPRHPAHITQEKFLQDILIQENIRSAKKRKLHISLLIGNDTCKVTGITDISRHSLFFMVLELSRSRSFVSNAHIEAFTALTLKITVA